MLVYIEKSVKNLETTKKILSRLWKNTQILEIDHYKNIFDKSIKDNKISQSIILARSRWTTVLQAPEWYWYTPYSFFVRFVLNCIFDCKYCYLKWAFKSRIPVIFVNYEEIAEEIQNFILNFRKNHSTEKICFYASNYWDIQAIDNIIGFNDFFIPFFEKFKNVIVESRTKSSNIQTLLKLENIPKNFEIAFSLNPEEICKEYEIWASKLQNRIFAINQLLEKWFKVGLRFLPIIAIWQIFFWLQINAKKY